MYTKKQVLCIKLHILAIVTVPDYYFTIAFCRNTRFLKWTKVVLIHYFVKL